jgi:hypothetical protein
MHVDGISRMIRQRQLGQLIIFLFVALPLMSSCRILSADDKEALVNVKVKTTELRSQQFCIGHFVPHKLSFANGLRVREIGLYLNNGSGLAINDLDDDGDLDIVFAGVDRDVGIFWNQGNMIFEEEILDERFPRGVMIVDVDGDSYLDLVFSHRGLQGVTYWRNLGRGSGADRFAKEGLPGVDSYAYTMAWGDINQDGMLDLVTGSYNVELIQNGIAVPESDPKAGIFSYEQTQQGFTPQRLAMDSQTLSIALVDLDANGESDIWVANDFDLQDYIWLREDGRWNAARPFSQTPHSTMSTEWGYITNDGRLALLSTDMAPYDHSEETVNAWMPVMEGMMGEMGDMEMHHNPADPQIMENVLQMQYPTGWENEARRRGIEAAGWAWSAKFGDLDLDGFLDLYIVNGMIGINMLSHLKNHELIEENQAFRNLQNGVFAAAEDWNLGATESGRGMVMADLDQDGDLDIVVNNLRGSAYLFENQLCSSGDGVEVDLRWNRSKNTRAVGSHVILRTSQGLMMRDVRTSGGYLSGDPSRIHFGVPAGADLLELRIIWPDGKQSLISKLAPQTLIQINRR